MHLLPWLEGGFLNASTSFSLLFRGWANPPTSTPTPPTSGWQAQTCRDSQAQRAAGQGCQHSIQILQQTEMATLCPHSHGTHRHLTPEVSGSFACSSPIIRQPRASRHRANGTNYVGFQDSEVLLPPR